MTITGSLGNIGRSLVTLLIAKGHEVTVISHSPERADAIRALAAVPAIGSIEDVNFLANAFAGADAVFLMIPPRFDAADTRGYMLSVADAYVAALSSSGVRHVVNLSSIGAHIPDGPGPTGTNFLIEERLNALSGVNILHLRPGLFYTNFYGSIPVIRHQRVLGNNFSSAVPMLMTDPRDIAEEAARAMDQRDPSGVSICYVVSDEKNGGDIAGMLGRSIGQPELPWIQLADEDLLGGLVANGMSVDAAQVYVVGIGAGLRDQLLFDDYRHGGHRIVGKTRFEDFAREFAAVYGLNS